MTVLTGLETGLPAYVYREDVVKVDELPGHTKRGKPVSHSRIFLHNDKATYDYFLDVVESPTEVSKRFTD